MMVKQIDDRQWTGGDHSTCSSLVPSALVPIIPLNHYQYLKFSHIF